ELMAIHSALEDLAAIDPRKGKVFELRYFGGLSVEEAAEALNVSPATVAREWRMAKAWLRREIGDGGRHGGRDGGGDGGRDGGGGGGAGGGGGGRARWSLIAGGESTNCSGQPSNASPRTARNSWRRRAAATRFCARRSSRCLPRTKRIERIARFTAAVSRKPR